MIISMILINTKMQSQSQVIKMSTEPIQRKTRNAGINLSYEMLKVLDDLRGDIPKSRFTMRLIERAAMEQKQQQQNQEAVKTT